jgi:rod shape-determining protein MreC
MSGSNIHFSNASVFFTFLIIGAALLFLPAHLTSKISLAFYDIFEPVLRIGREVQMDALRLHPGQEESVSLAEYQRLWKSYKNLHAQMLALHTDYERVSKVRSGLPALSAGIVPAEITGTVSNYSQEVIINKGRLASIRPGQYVLSEQNDCLIGVVHEVTEMAAKVRLITDAKQSLEVRIHRDDTDKDIGAMMFGDGLNACKIPMLDKEQDIREGDTIYAAAISGKLDVPLVIGEIVEVKTDDLHPLLWDITVAPAEAMGHINKVAVIVADEMLLKKED